MDQLIRRCLAIMLAGTLQSCGTSPRDGPRACAANQGQVHESAPAPVLITHARGWGTATPLADGTLVVTSHVFRHFPTEINGQPPRSLDVIRRPRRLPGRLGEGECDQSSFEGDWVQLRVEPSSAWAGGWKPHPDVVSRGTIPPGTVVEITGYARSADTPPRAVLCTVLARIVEPPGWAEAGERMLFFAQAVAADTKTDGMSGGPVVLVDAAGNKQLVGIFLGRITRDFFGVGQTRLVVQPWPPAE